MARKVNLNADMGEGFGAYDIGDDSAILKVVTSANVACGFHAGDPNTMRRSVELAKTQGVSVGAHPGFNDLWGFGRRRIDTGLADLENMIAYQIGALQGIAAACGSAVTHVKLHGALSNMAAEDYDIALAGARAVKAVDARLIYLAQAGTQMIRAARDVGLTVAEEVFADRAYEDNGMLVSRKKPGAVLHDPAQIVAQVVAMVRDRAVRAVSGRQIPVRADSICVHGDEPTAVAAAAAVRKGLEDAGFQVVPLPELGLA
jgi:UPF0271 protein